MKSLVQVELPTPSYADPDLLEYLNQNQAYTLSSPGMDRLSNVFVSHYGLVSKYGWLNRHCMPNLFPPNDISQFWSFQKEVAFQEAVCRFGSSLKVRTLEKGKDYILIHHKWFGYAFWMSCFMPRLLRALALPKSRNTALLVSKRWMNFPFVKDSLSNLDIELEILDLDEHAFVPHLILPHSRKTSSCFFETEMKAVRSFFYKKYGIKSQTPTRKIWIHRSEKARRAILNENEVLEILLNRGYTPIVFEELGLKEQVQLLSETSVLAGLHGAGLANAIFLQNQAQLLEFIPETFAAYGHPFTFRSMANALNVRYGVSGIGHSSKPNWTPPQKTKANIRLDLINSHQSVSIEKLNLALSAINA